VQFCLQGPSPKWLYCVGRDIKLYSLTHASVKRSWMYVTVTFLSWNSISVLFLSTDIVTWELLEVCLLGCTLFDFVSSSNVGAICNFQEHMFSFESENEKFALKPMNCPGHWWVAGYLCFTVHIVQHAVRNIWLIVYPLAEYGNLLPFLHLCSRSLRILQSMKDKVVLCVCWDSIFL